MAAEIPMRDMTALLQTAVHLSDIASAIHHEAAPAHMPLPGLCLTDAARRLDPTDPGMTGPLAPADLVAASRKVGQDLILRLERIEKARVIDATDFLTVDVALLRQMWSMEDVAALRHRLGGLLRRWQKEAGLPAMDHEGALTIQLDDSKSGYATEEKDPKSFTQEFGPIDNASDTHHRLDRLNLNGRTPTVSADIIHDFLLENLAYKSMHDREQEITKAHLDTLKWIFDKTPKNESQEKASRELATFLRTNGLGSIYWITGKPGSGKSTLTEFLSNHGSTAGLLQQWACGRRVSQAEFYFWTSGSKDQRSQTGLLRSLLYQLLKENPDLTPYTFPNLWAKLSRSTTKERIMMVIDWAVDELMSAFNRFLKAAIGKNINIGLFLDGLDEFEGDHEAIVSFFKSICSGQAKNHVKLCLSSRPWAVFEKAFNGAVPNLKLQDVTVGDMYAYTLDKLRQEPNTRSALTQISEEDQIAFITDMTRRADGVFLWIRLAVNRLYERLGSSAGPQSLQAVVLSLPTDLDDLFAKFIFEDQDQQQLAQAAAIFQLMHAREAVAGFLHDESSNSLTSWELIYALHEAHDKSASEWSVEQMGYEDIQELVRELAITVSHRFAGLLILHEQRRGGNLVTTKEAALAGQRVTYVHRTVRDWLMEGDGVFERLTCQSPTNFDPHLHLLRSYVLRLKRPVDEVEHHRRLDDWWPDIALAMTHARHITNDCQGLQRPLINEMDKTLSWYWKAKNNDPHDHWARSAFGTYEVRMKAPPIWQPFLCLATKFGLTQYVSEELTARIEAVSNDRNDAAEPTSQINATPVLTYATEFLCSRNKTIYPLSDPALVKILLQQTRSNSPINRGPNDEYLDFVTKKPTTPWLMMLRHLRDARRRGWIEYYDLDTNGTARWIEIVKVFLEEGAADPRAVVEKDAWDAEISAIGVLRLLEETYGAVEIKRLREYIEEKQAAMR